MCHAVPSRQPQSRLAPQAGETSSRGTARSQPDAQLADAQFELAKQYGFSSWRALKTHVDSLTVNGQLVDAAQNGDVNVLTALLDRHPDGLHVRSKPYRVVAAAPRREQGTPGGRGSPAEPRPGREHPREGRQHLCDALVRGSRSTGRGAATGSTQAVMSSGTVTITSSRSSVGPRAGTDATTTRIVALRSFS